MTYHPRPIQTAHVELSPQVLELTERLAENNHDIWAQRRIAEGWTHGKCRDDQRKTHPGLVPYSQLEESERQYDRDVALGTLKAILALGYRIEPAAES